MSDQLPNYVLENYAKASSMELGAWLAENPLPSICEQKLDGIRVFLFKSGDKLVISSKHGAIYTPKSSPKVFTYVTEFLHAPNRMILDGEYVSNHGLYFFDILQVDDREVRNLPLNERKKILNEILAGTGLEVKFELVRNAREIQKLRDEEIQRGGEGILVKNPESAYGERNSWLKLKRFDTIDCFVTGFEETKEMRQTGIPHSWRIAVYDDFGQVVELGKVGSYIEKIDPRQVKEGTVVELRFQEVTEDLKLRAPFIIRIRHDKTPSECLLSQVRRNSGSDPT
jgi:ATP-dependent DNA ligase